MRITNETTVTINYRLTDKEGTLIEETDADNPASYLHGLGMMLPGVEEALEGKAPGDKTRVELDAENAYGERLEELVITVPIDEFEEPEKLETESEIIVRNGEEEIIMTISEIGDATVTLDGNHPYAGTDVIFEIEVVDVHKTTDEDVKHFSHDHGDCDCGECEGHE
jgi:FKBP-type peptidyl-prolyl cis-trans isomerase SlyD